VLKELENEYNLPVKCKKKKAEKHGTNGIYKKYQ
jgi:hypothetical protein